MSTEANQDYIDPETQGFAKNIRDQLKLYVDRGDRLEKLEARLNEQFWGAVSPFVRRILKIFELLYRCELELLPRDQLETLLTRVHRAINELNHLADFRPGGTRGPQDFLNDTRGAWHGLHNDSVQYILVANMLGGKAEEEAAVVISELRLARLAAQADLVSIGKVLDDTRKAAAEIGVSQQAIHFKNVADSYNRQSWIWLVFLALSVGAGCVYALMFLPNQFNSLPADLPVSRLTQLIFNKVLIVSLLFFGIGWLARNFTAARHNFVTNQHRQTALSTFETIVNGVKDDPQARNAVLVYASQAIFMPTNTGYGKGDIEVQQINPIVDLVSSARKLVP